MYPPPMEEAAAEKAEECGAYDVAPDPIESARGIRPPSQSSPLVGCSASAGVSRVASTASNSSPAPSTLLTPSDADISGGRSGTLDDDVMAGAGRAGAVDRSWASLSSRWRAGGRAGVRCWDVEERCEARLAVMLMERAAMAEGPCGGVGDSNKD